MKKLIIGLLTLFILAICSLTVMAGPGGPPQPGPKKNHGWEEKQPHYGPKEHQLQSDARYIIDRSAKVLADAQRIARKGRRYSGFALAMAHQQKARKLYANGEYRDAIYFSLRARDLAFQIIRNNKERWRPEFNPDEREGRYKDGPRGEELDKRLNLKIGQDDEALRIKIELNI